MSDKIAIYTIQEIKKKIIGRFYPRELIIGEIPFRIALEDSFDELNQNVFIPRMFEFNIANNVIDLTDIDIEGIEVNKVINIIAPKDYLEYFPFYSVFPPNFTFSGYRDNTIFTEYLLRLEVFKQITARFKVINDYIMNGDKLILGNSFTGITKSVVIFYPHFSTDSTVNSWELCAIEQKFLFDYLEGLVSTREGRALKMAQVMDINIDADFLIEDGEKKMESTLENFKRIGYCQGAKRF